MTLFPREKQEEYREAVQRKVAKSLHLYPWLPGHRGEATARARPDALVQTDLAMTDKLTVLTCFKSSVGTQRGRALPVLLTPPRPTCQVGSMA